jgi:hypothetical protein
VDLFNQIRKKLEVKCQVKTLLLIYRSSMLWWSSRTLTKLKSQSQKRFKERKYQYVKYKNKNHSVQFKGFNISQMPKSSPLSYFAQKTSLILAPNWYSIIFTCPFQSDSCSYISNIHEFFWAISRLSDGTSEKNQRFPNVPVRRTNLFPLV